MFVRGGNCIRMDMGKFLFLFLCCFICLVHNKPPLNKHKLIFLMQTHALITKSRLCIIIMSSDIVHSIDTNQSECEGVKNWFEVCQFNRDNGFELQGVNYMLYDTRGPLIEFESSDNRGSNNQQFKQCNGIGIRPGLKIQFEYLAVFEKSRFNEVLLYAFSKTTNQTVK